MRITKIHIENVKGIKNEEFNFELIPNKPNIFVAPNGYGKSSFAIAFDSLKRDRIELEDNNYHLDMKTNTPSLQLSYTDGTTSKCLVADSSKNFISKDFDCFVINSKVMAKATKIRIGSNVIAKSSLEISPIVLINTIPKKFEFNYNLKTIKSDFGVNGKILSDISAIIKSSKIIENIISNVDLKLFGLKRNGLKLEEIIRAINGISGTSDYIKDYIECNFLVNFKTFTELSQMSEIILPTLKTKNYLETESFLAAIQIVKVYLSSPTDFNKALKYLEYLGEKKYYEEILNGYNTTRHKILPREDKKSGSLIIEFPKATQISNGQRDVLTFITLLMKAKKNFKKKNCILVIDEIFDYLDDANLISFQYFITSIIDEMKGKDKNFFPILMTHLDPLYFNHFCFNKHKLKVFYLKDIPNSSNQNLVKLIRNRELTSIKLPLSKYYFHYHPSSIDLSSEFTSESLSIPWNTSDKFNTMIKDNIDMYLNGISGYDPLAVCFAVRLKIEELLYNSIVVGVNKDDFINIHGTKNKLEYCESLGLVVPEIYYLLGIIYNDNLHLRNDKDIAKPLAIKLENLTIRLMIRSIFA